MNVKKEYNTISITITLLEKKYSDYKKIDDEICSRYSRYKNFEKIYYNYIRYVKIFCSYVIEEFEYM